MTDAARLHVLLTDYATSLDSHLGIVREEFSQLERAWAALSDVYEGTAAEQFRKVFLSAAARMRDYEHGASGLLVVVRRRLEALERFDAPAATL